MLVPGPVLPSFHGSVPFLPHPPNRVATRHRSTGLVHILFDFVCLLLPFQITTVLLRLVTFATIHSTMSSFSLASSSHERKGFISLSSGG